MKRRSFWWLGLAVIAVALSVLASPLWQEAWIAAPTSVLQVAQETPDSDSPPSDVNGLAIAGDYTDPQGNFQIGVIEGYTVNSAAGSPLFQNGDGSLAYSVVRVPLNGDALLSEIGLVEIAQQTLGQGEGFQTQTFNTVADGGVQIAWTGRFSQGAAPPQPLTGTVLVKQQGAEAYLLIVAALEAATGQVPNIVSTLAGTLVIL